jgi:hypothetical protein
MKQELFRQAYILLEGGSQLEGGTGCLTSKQTYLLIVIIRENCEEMMNEI